MKAVVVSAVLLSSSLALAAVPQYSVTALDAPAGQTSSASSVSLFGAAGQIDHGDGTTAAAVWTAAGRTDLPLINGFTRGFGNGINNAGVVVGSVGTLRAPPQGTMWVNGVGSLLPTEDNDDDTTEFLFGSIASAINAGGTIVGQSANQYGDTGVVWSPNGDIRLLMGLAPEGEYQYSWAQGINDVGTIAGYAKDENGRNRAMRWKQDTATPLGTFFDEGETVGHGLNSLGDVVGWGTTEDGFGNAFVYTNDTLVKLPRLPGTDYGEAFGINDEGLIVGGSLESGVTGRGFATIWLDGQVYNLESLLTNNLGGEWELHNAYSLSDDGKIVGFGIHNGETEAFLLTPVPEPGSLSALLITLPMMRRRRK